MSNNIFLITLALVLALVAISLLSGWSYPWGIPANADDAYYYAGGVVTAKCGPNTRLLGILVQQAFTRYAFTRGTCGSGSANEYVSLSYDFKKRSVEDFKISNFALNNELDFLGPDNTLPISVLDWKISSERAFQIVSAHGGPENPKAGDLRLRQTGNSLIWGYSYQAGSYQSGWTVSWFQINAATGQVISSGSAPAPAPF